MQDRVSITRHGHVAHVEMIREDKMNALDKDMMEGLVEAAETLGQEDDVRAVVLSGRGKAFCAGLDLQSESWGDDASPQALLAMQRDISDIYRAMRRCPQPIIALIQGAACGGGFSLALASDIRIAATTAKMNAAFIRAGLTACDMGCSYLLPRLVGLSVASELMMTGKFISAERALKVNLVSEVVSEQELATTAEQYVADLLATSPMGLRLTKDGLNFSVDAPSLDAAMALEDRQQALVAGSADAREAINAFLEKRAPIWKNQ